MKIFSKPLFSFLCLTSCLVPESVRAADAKPEPGLALTIDAAGQKETSVAQNVWLHVEPGESASPFVAPGKFSATWNGQLNADLRGSFSFQAELSGHLKLEINGTTVIEASGDYVTSPLSKPIQLNKGSNSFRATFNSPANGAAFVRLSWTEKPPFTGPIPNGAFAHSATPELQKATQVRLGRELFLEHRCFKCHTDAKLADSGVPEVKMDAPAFEGIGARRNFDWMARWIADPKSLRPAALMPKLLHGATAKEDAEAMAAYLASLRTGGEAKLPQTTFVTHQNKPAEEGDGATPHADPKPLYERLHCVGCHNPPDSTQPDPAKLSQKRIAEKFPTGKLAEFLRLPDAHYKWTRMPGFHLSEKEAKELEDWLFAAAPKPELKPAPIEAAIIEKGKKLVQTTGCLNCHELKLDNQFKAPPLDALHSRHAAKREKSPAGDCLGATPSAHHSFTAVQRAALDAFTRAGFGSLARHVPAEFAERQSRLLNCTACHGQIDLIPPFEILGGKLKPEWAAKFISGEIPHKLRYDAHPKGEPWVDARMPAYKSHGALLARGLSQSHGYAPKSPAETPVDMAMAEHGRKLVGKDGGLSCVSCHAVGPMLAMEVFESEGINLAFSADRMLPDFFRRWFRAPTTIDPQTKMPVYFDEGKSPLTDILEGDGEKQITAVWEYLKLREKMPAPKVSAE